MSDPARIRDASTVILLRRDLPGPRVLMGMRGAGAAFMPSKFVFPGGAVDPEDDDEGRAVPGIEDPALTAEPREGSTVTAAALHACAIRELREETGLGLRAGAPLHLIFRAITPPGRPRRFDARFFLIDAADIAGDPDDFTNACDELSHLAWVPIDEARALDLPFITEVVLAEVAALAGRGGPLGDAPTVPFFDNRSDQSRFVQIAR